MSLLDALLLDPAPFELWISDRTDGIKGCGSVSDPFNGSTQARFDAVMQEIATQYAGQKVVIHIGPGEFETKGYPTSGGWQIKSGMRILGSGMDATTLKLVDVGASHGYAVGHDLDTRADYAEVSDLTIDCNLETPGGYTIHGAVRLMGNYVKVHRVKAIHWGGGAEVSGGGCVVFSIITVDEEADAPELANGGFENCVAIEPASEPDTGVTVFQIGGTGVSSFSREHHGKSPYIRNCYVDGGVTTPDPSAGWRVAIAASWCRGGVVEGNQIYNVDVGITQSARAARDLIVRNNFLKNAGVGISLAPAMGSVLGAGDLALDGTVATISDISTEHLLVGDRVRLVASPSALSGMYVVASIVDEFSFTVNTAVTSPTSATLTAYPLRSAARAVVEGNTIELVAGEAGAAALVIEDDIGTDPAPEAPDYMHGDIIIRNNKVRYVDGALPEDGGAKLIEVSGVKHLIVQSNVVDTVATLPLQNRRCGNATYFNNRTPSGVLLRGWDDDLDRKYDEWETEAEDAFVLAFFNER